MDKNGILGGRGGAGGGESGKGNALCWQGPWPGCMFCPGATMSALLLTAGIIWCVCSIKSNRHKDGFHRLRQHHDDYEDEIRMMSTGSKKSLLSHEFQDETDTEEETLYSSKHWPICWQGRLPAETDPATLSISQATDLDHTTSGARTSVDLSHSYLCTRKLCCAAGNFSSENLEPGLFQNWFWQPGCLQFTPGKQSRGW